MTFNLRLDLSAFDHDIDETAEEVEAAARPAAQAMAQVMYDEVNRNVAKLGKKTGNLASAIYQAYSRDASSEGVAVYHVSWNAKKAPHGHLVEFGHLQKYKVYLKDGKWYTLKGEPLDIPKHVAATPFIRPSLSKSAQAQEAGEAEFLRRINLA